MLNQGDGHGLSPANTPEVRSVNSRSCFEAAEGRGRQQGIVSQIKNPGDGLWGPRGSLRHCTAGARAGLEGCSVPILRIPAVLCGLRQPSLLLSSCGGMIFGDS